MDLKNKIFEKINGKIYNLTYKEKIILNSFLDDSPNITNYILNSIKNIVNNSEINLEDIPSIINTITKIYCNEFLVLDIRSYKYIIDMIKITMESIIELDILYIKNLPIKNIEQMLNDSLEIFNGIKKEEIKKEEYRCWNFYL